MESHNPFHGSKPPTIYIYIDISPINHNSYVSSSHHQSDNPIYSMVLEYLPTFAWTKSPSHVGKYAIHGAYGNIDIIDEPTICQFPHGFPRSISQTSARRPTSLHRLARCRDGPHRNSRLRRRPWRVKDRWNRVSPTLSWMKNCLRLYDNSGFLIPIIVVIYQS